MSDNQPDQPQPASAPPTIPDPSTASWLDAINGYTPSESRMAGLRDLTERQRIWAAQPDAERDLDASVFTGIPLTGADVFWLAALARPDGAVAKAADQLRAAQGNVAVQATLDFSALHLERAFLYEAHLDGATLGGAHLEQATLEQAHLDGAFLYEAHLDGATLEQAHLDGATLEQAHLERADFAGAHLAGANLRRAHLEGTSLFQAHLAEAALYEAHLERADLRWAHLERADLNKAHLEGANLRLAHLDGVNLYQAHLEGADLNRAHLEGADLNRAHLEGKTYPSEDHDVQRIKAQAPDFPLTLAPADLRGVVFDAATSLNDVTLGSARHGTVRVADLRWGSANLAVIDWTLLLEPAPQLGDEREASTWTPKPFTPLAGKPSRQKVRAARQAHDKEQAAEKLEAFRAAVRANRQLATALRDQGLNEEADQFAYRAQVLQRQVFHQQGKRGRARLSRFLDLVAGHGYKPERSLYAYLGVIVTFAVLYLLAGNGLLTFGLPLSQFHGLPWYEALILSVSSFHGRGFFQPVNSLGDPVAVLAALEAVFGLFIEVSFIATFTQRFFGK